MQLSTHAIRKKVDPTEEEKKSNLIEIALFEFTFFCANSF